MTCQRTEYHWRRVLVTACLTSRTAVECASLSSSNRSRCFWSSCDVSRQEFVRTRLWWSLTRPISGSGGYPCDRGPSTCNKPRCTLQRLYGVIGNRIIDVIRLLLSFKVCGLVIPYSSETQNFYFFIYALSQLTSILVASRSRRERLWS